MNRWSRSPFLVLIALLLFSCGGGQKENTHDKGKAERKEQKDTNASKADASGPEITAAKFANAVRQRILEKARENDSVLVLPDPRNEDSLSVKLVKVVEKSVSKFSEDVRYVCGKFKGTKDGMRYDIDFYLEGNEPSSLEPHREPLLHKVDGEARYKYVEKEGFKRPERVKQDKGVEKEGSDEEDP